MKALFILTAFFSLFTLNPAQEIDMFVNRGYVDGFLYNGMKGNPKSVEIINFTIAENHQVTDDKTTIKNTYDEKGRHSTSTLYSDSTSYSAFFYDDNDRVIKFSMDHSVEVFDYNKEGQIVESLLHFHSDSREEFKTYTYNLKDNEITILKTNADSVHSETLLRFKENNKIIEVTTYSREANELIPILKEQFDKNKNRISVSFYDQNSNIYTSNFYYYNEKGDVEKMEVIRFNDGLEVLKDVIHVNLVYDQFGNKIKEEQTWNGNLINYLEYHIEYYGE